MPLQSGDDPSVVTDPTEPTFLPGEGTEVLDSDIFGSETSSDPDDPHGPFWVAPSDEEPLPESSSSDSAEAPDADPLAAVEFDQRHRQDFEGLLYIGKLNHTFEKFGHTFTIHTLTVDELLRTALLVREWEGTIGSNRAYVTAMAAAACDLVDRKPVYQPIGPGDDEIAGKFKYVREHWYSWVVDEVYSQLMALEQRVQEIIDAMGEGSG